MLIFRNCRTEVPREHVGHLFMVSTGKGARLRIATNHKAGATHQTYGQTKEEATRDGAGEAPGGGALSKSRERAPKKIEGLRGGTDCARKRKTVQAIETLRPKHALSHLLKASSMARATYYYHQKLLANPDRNEGVRKQICSIYHANKGRYGYRRITLALRNQSVTINHKKVVRLMQECGLKCLVRIKKYRSYRGNVGKIAPNILERNFTTLAINKKWVTDITEFALFGQKRYLSPILDLYNGEIISYTISAHPNLLLVTSMLQKALKNISNGADLILHSDQGWHYQHAAYQKLLKGKGIAQSMSRKGNCLDNATMENFFGLLKSELLYLQKFSSIEEFEKELESYIFYYNNFRIKQKLKGLSPVQYRNQSLLIA